MIQCLRFSTQVSQVSNELSQGTCLSEKDVCSNSACRRGKCKRTCKNEEESEEDYESDFVTLLNGAKKSGDSTATRLDFEDEIPGLGQG